MSIAEQHRGALDRLAWICLAIAFLGAGSYWLAATLQLPVLAFISFLLTVVAVVSGGVVILFLFVHNARFLRNSGERRGMASESIGGEERLGIVLRVLCAVAGGLVLYISGAFLITAPTSATWVQYTPAIVGLVLGIGLALLAILGRRSPFFESLAASAYEALTRS